MRTTRERLRLDVARRLRRADGLARLAQLFVERGPPTFRRSANGPACTAPAVRDWLHRGGGTTRFIEPGRPWANGAGESFNGTRRDAGRKRERFATLLEAPILIAGWRREDNPIRPHRALGYRPPPPPPRKRSNPGNVPCRASRRSDSLNDWSNDRGQVTVVFQNPWGVQNPIRGSRIEFCPPRRIEIERISVIENRVVPEPAGTAHIG